MECTCGFFRLENPLPRPDKTPPDTQHGSSRQHAKGNDNINVVIVNCRSVYRKVPELLSLINGHNAHIVLGTESWLKPEVNNNEILNSDWNVYCRDRLDSEGGGVFIAIKSAIVSKEIDGDPKCEIIWVKVTVKAGSNMVIGCLYRPPGSAAVVAEHLKENLENISSRFPDHVIVLGGDFNLPDIDWETQTFISGGRDKESSEIFLSALSENYLEQLNRELTRGDNILDLLVTNRPELFETVNAEQGISDHKAVTASMISAVNRNIKKGRKSFLFSISDKK